MHKTTIFLTIFAFFSLTFLMEQKVGDKSSSSSDLLKANSVYFQSNSTTESNTNEEDITQAESKIDHLNESLDESSKGFFDDFIKKEQEPNQETTDQIDSKNQEDLSQSDSTVKQANDVNQPNQTSLSSSDIKKYFHAIDIDDLEILQVKQEKLFDVIDLNNLGIQNLYQYNFAKYNNKMAETTELAFEDSLTANKAYTYIKAVTLSFKGVEVNENNQFNDSFYINNPAKPFQVFLVIKKDNKVYAFTYLKEIHDKFKGFYEILL